LFKYCVGVNPLFKSKLDGNGKLLGAPSWYCWYCPFTTFALIPDTEYPGCPEATACNVDWFVAKMLVDGVPPSYADRFDPSLF
jgi:hypothetical protein